MPDRAITSPAAPDVTQLQAELQAAFGARLQIVEPLGAGGMGHVFLARDPALKRSVAIKTLAPHLAGDETARQRFAREAQATAALAHPHVISIHEVGELPASKVPYFVMAFIEGDTMEKVIAGGPMSQPALRRLLAEVASALAAAHERGLVHRDIKPANIMLERGSGRAVVLDFGIAAASSAAAAGGPVNLTATGTYIGTPTHMSPEQALGQAVTDRSDIYSLGLVAFEAASGQPTFKADTPFALIAKHIHEQPPALRELRPDMDPEVATLIDRCLVKAPEQRPTAREISRQLSPESQTIIEWPPPGLETLRERGVSLLRSLNWTAAIMLAFILAIYVQPRMSTAAWREGETSLFWKAVWAPHQSNAEVIEREACVIRHAVYDQASCPESALDSTPLWFFIVFALATAFLIMALIVLRRAIMLEREGRRMGKAGYPITVMASVAGDRHADTGALMNGLGVFASLDAATRARFTALRRNALIAQVGGVFLVLLFPMVFLFVARTSGSARDAFYLGTGELLVLLLPALAYAAAVAFGWQERQWKRAARRASGKKAPPPMRSDVVRAWLQTSRDNALQPKALGRPVLFALPIVMLGSIALVTFVGEAVAFNSKWTNPILQRWMNAWFTGQSAEQPAAVSPIRMGQVDSALRTLTTFQVVARDTIPGPWVVETYKRAGSSPYTDVESWWDSLHIPSFPSAGRLARAARDTAGIPLYRLRRLAAHLTRNIEDSMAFRGIGSNFRYQELVRHNATAAFLALKHGDTALAVRRLRENIIVGRSTLLRTGPRFTVGSIGGNAAASLAKLAAAIGDQGTAAQAWAAADLVRRYRQSTLIMQWSWRSLLSANPNDTSILAEIANRENSPEIRLSLVDGIVNGYCHNGRELLFGVSPRRAALLQRAIEATSDLTSPRRDMRNRYMRGQLEVMRSKPGILGLKARLRYCPY